MVIAIVGILAAFLLLALGTAKSRARQAACTHNLHQLGIALHGFVTDYGVYPLFINQEYVHGGYSEHATAWNVALERTQLSGRDWLQSSPQTGDRVSGTVQLLLIPPKAMVLITVTILME